MLLSCDHLLVSPIALGLLYWASGVSPFTGSNLLVVLGSYWAKIYLSGGDSAVVPCLIGNGGIL